MAKTANICLLIPYYGAWPVYLNLFVESCRSNKQIDVHLISDLQVDIDLPTNVKLMNIPMKELLQRLEKATGIHRQNISPRKICDLKPAYGLMFDDLTLGYDFWAYGDIDLVFGDLDRYLKPSILAEYDILTFREEWIHGPFTIFRNNDRTKNLFRLSRDYEKVFSDDMIYCFDECGKKHGILRTGIDPLEIEVPHRPNDVHCMTQVIRKEELEGNLKVYRRYYAKESLPFDEIIWWEDGKIKGAGFAEYIFYHFVWDKKQKEFAFPKWRSVPKKYFITTTGFYRPGNRLWLFTHYWRKMLAPIKRMIQRGKDSLRYRLGLFKILNQ